MRRNESCSRLQLVVRGLSVFYAKYILFKYSLSFDMASSSLLLLVAKSISALSKNVIVVFPHHDRHGLLLFEHAGVKNASTLSLSALSSVLGFQRGDKP